MEPAAPGVAALEDDDAPPRTISEVLADDAVDSLFAKLSVESLRHCSGTCRAWRSIALSGHRWNQAVDAHLGSAAASNPAIYGLLDEARGGGGQPAASASAGTATASALGVLQRASSVLVSWGLSDDGPQDWGVPTAPPGTFGVLGRGALGHLLGDIAQRALANPYPVANLQAVPLSSIGCGGYHSVALASGGGGAFAWGAGGFGQLGLGDRESRGRATPILLPPGALPTDAICGYAFTMLRLDDGSWLSCGFNRNGRCGVPPRSAVSTISEDGDPLLLAMTPCAAAAELRAAGVTIEAASAGSGHAAFLGCRGAIFAFGRTDRGQVGAAARDAEVEGDTFTTRVESSEESWRPLRAHALPRAATQVAAGAYHTLGLLAASGAPKAPAEVWSWGSVVGDGGAGEQREAHRVEGLPAGVVAVAAGSFASAAIADGEVWVWGGAATELAFPSWRDTVAVQAHVQLLQAHRGPPRPLRVCGLRAHRVASISLGGHQAIATAEDGTPLVWTRTKLDLAQLHLAEWWRRMSEWRHLATEQPEAQLVGREVELRGLSWARRT